MDTQLEILIIGAVGTFLYAFGNRILNFIPVLTNFLFGYRFYVVTQQDKVIIATRKLNERSSELRNDKDASGFFCGWLYFGHIDVSERWNGMERTLHIFSNQRTYEELMTDPNPVQHDFSKYVELIENDSPYHYPNYKQRTITITASPTVQQQKCMEKIISLYRTQGQGRNITVFIYGPPGSGKSMTAMLLANALNGTLCKDFRPAIPGHSLRSAHAAANATPNHPLVFTMEEADVLINRIHHTEVPPHKMLVTPIVDKTSWNGFLDDIDNGFYPYMITILTSNKSPQEINQIDPAYIREGRVHLIWEMQKESSSDSGVCLLDIEDD